MFTLKAGLRDNCRELLLWSAGKGRGDLGPGEAVISEAGRAGSDEGGGQAVSPKAGGKITRR